MSYCYNCNTGLTYGLDLTCRLATRSHLSIYVFCLLSPYTYSFYMIHGICYIFYMALFQVRERSFNEINIICIILSVLTAIVSAYILNNFNNRIISKLSN